MNSEIIQNVTYDDNYDDFQHDNFIFSQIGIIGKLSMNRDAQELGS